MSSDPAGSESGPALLAALEAISRERPDRLLRLRGHRGDEPFELLIFRGFSCSTTHPTAFDPDQSLLSEDARIEAAELLQGPLNPAAEKLLAGPLPPGAFRDPLCWS